MSYGLVEDRVSRVAPASVVRPPYVVRGIYGMTDRGLTGFFMNGVPAFFEPTNAREEHKGAFRFYLTVSHTDSAVYGQSSAKEFVGDQTILLEQLSQRLGLDSIDEHIDLAGLERAVAWNEGVGRTMLSILHRKQPRERDLDLIKGARWAYVSFDPLKST